MLLQCAEFRTRGVGKALEGFRVEPTPPSMRLRAIVNYLERLRGLARL
jgi:hypothetical protein